MPDLTFLQTAWFVAIAALWTLYLVLEGFDFGVGMLLRRVRRDHHDRRVALHAIGPTWAANEVWVVIAVVAMFGAFPGWYAAWASGLYLPLLVVLLALIARNAGVELIGKRSDERWRTRWERTIAVASTVAPFCWGLMWSAVVQGLALRGEEVVAAPLDVLSAYSVLGGVALVALCRAQGAAFLALRTDGDVQGHALAELRRAAPAAALLVGALLAWTAAAEGAGAGAWIAVAVGAGALVVLAAAGSGLVGAPARPGGDAAEAGGAGARRGTLPREGVAFAAGCAAVAALVATWFCTLFPAGIGAADGGPALALADVAAGSYTLGLMTGLVAILLPLLLAVQAWSYWVFRHRVTRAAVGAPIPGPVELAMRVAGRGGGDGAARPEADGAAAAPGPLLPGLGRRRRPEAGRGGW